MTDQDTPEEPQATTPEDPPHWEASLAGETAERMRAEAALRQSEERAQFLLDTVRVSIYECDTDGVILWANAAAERMTNRTRSELIGTRVWDRMGPGPQKESLAAYLKHLALHQPTPSPYFTTIFTRDGRRVDIQVDWSYKRNPQGQVVGFACAVSDITEIKQAEEALKRAHEEMERRVEERTQALQQANALLQREIEERQRAEQELAIFERFTEASSIGVGMADMDGQITYVNPALCRIVDEDRPEDIIGKGIATFCPSQFRQKLDQEVLPTVSSQGQWAGEMDILSRLGRIVPTIHNAFLIFDDSGQPLRLAVSVVDLTERKQAQEALRASEERFRVIFEEAPVGMVICTENGRIVRVNEAMCRMTGFDTDWFAQCSYGDVTYPADIQPCAKQFQRLCAGEIPSFSIQKRYLKKQGGFFWSQTRVAAVKDAQGKVAFIMAIAEDITERIHVQEALRASEEKYKALVETSPDGVVMVDLEGRITFASPRTAQMHGSERAEALLGKSALDFLVPEDHPRFLANFRTTVEEGVTRNIEYSFRRADGTYFTGEISAAAFNDARGKPNALVAILRDVTQRRQVQEALERDRHTLKHLLRASDHERQLIAYDIHDGLAQHLAGAIMQLQVYEYQRATMPENADKAFDAGTSLLRQAHAEARRLISGVRPPILDASGVVAAIAHLVHDPACKQGPQIVFWTKMTRKRLAPVLENVIYRIVQEGLTNTRKHSKSERLLVSLLQQGDRLRITIQDWGVGFNPKVVRKDCFGLEGVRERVRILGGKFRIRSAPGQGTILVVELPVIKRGRRDQ